MNGNELEPNGDVDMVSLAGRLRGIRRPAGLLSSYTKCRIN